MRLPVLSLIAASHALAFAAGFATWPTLNARPLHPDARQQHELTRFVGQISRAHDRCKGSTHTACARYR